VAFPSTLPEEERPPPQDLAATIPSTAPTPQAPPQGVSSTALQNQTGPAAGGREIELGLKGSDLGFSCVRVASGRLLGGSFSVSLRLGAAEAGPNLDLGAVREGVRSECAQLADRILVPEAGLEVRSEGGQVTVRGQEGKRFSFPEADCLRLPKAKRGSADELATMLFERLVSGSKSGPALQSSTARWLEIRVEECGTGPSAAYRGSIQRTGSSAACSLAAVANDW